MPLYVRPSSRYVFAPSSLVPSSRATNTTPLSGRKSAKAAAPEEPLPETPPYPLAAGDDDDPWEEKFDEHSGLPYFVHRVTGESAWDKPGAELCGKQPLVWVVPTKLQNSLARSHRSRFG